MLLVSQRIGTIPTAIPTCLLLLLEGKGMNDVNTQPSKIRVVDKHHWACQRGPSLQRHQQVLLAMMATMVVMRVCQSA
jgi:hypothetical protein